jgi:hypothetical protein
MANTTAVLEKRIDALEKELAELKAEVRKRPPSHDWRETVGRFKDDPEFDEAMRLGAEWRRRENEKSIRELERRGEVDADPRHGSSHGAGTRRSGAGQPTRKKR